MKIRIDSLRPIRIARLADAEVDHVVFDISPWREAYPALTNYRVEVTSPGGIVYFPAKLVLDGNDFVWTITAEDTASAGDGLYQIVAAGTSGEHKTSAFAAFTVRATMPGTAEDTPPDPAKPWVDKVVEAAQRVEDATVHPPIIGANGNWLLWDFEASAYVDSGKPSQGGGSGGGGIAQETDPTVPAWAKQSNPPTYTAQDVGARPADWLPTPEEIGAQPAGNYALKSEIPAVPVQSVNGKTGAVELTAEDVNAASKESVDRLNEEIVDQGKAAVKSVNGVKPDENGDVQVQGGGSEGVYELVKELEYDGESTVIQIDKWFDTEQPCSFKRLKLVIEAPVHSQACNMLLYAESRLGSNELYIYGAEIAKTTQRLCIYEWLQDAGYWKIHYSSGNGSLQSNGSLRESIHNSLIYSANKVSAEDLPSIRAFTARVYNSTLPTGTIFKFYGVRA